MNPWTVAEEFRVFAENAPEIISEAARYPEGLKCVHQLTGGTGNTVSFPRLVFSARLKPLGRSAQVGTADVIISVESHSQDEEPTATAGEIHNRLIEIVRRKFHGATDAGAQAERAAVAAAISARGIMEVDPRIAPMQGNPDIEGQRFKTEVAIRCGVFLPT